MTTTWAQRSAEQATLPSRADLYRAREARTREFMRSLGVPAMLIVDPINIFYVSGTRNMDLFTMRTPARYLLVIEPGPVVLYEFAGSEHLAAGSPVVTDIRPAEALCRVSSGGDVAGAAHRLARDLTDVIRSTDPTIDRLAVDRFPYLVTDALRAAGFALSDADEVVTRARSVKLPIELPFMWAAMDRIEVAVTTLLSRSCPVAPRSRCGRSCTAT